MRLVADVGGTNCRMALAENGSVLPETVKSYRNAEWDDFVQVANAFLSAHSSAAPDEIIVAVAGPVHGGRAMLTNHNWRIDTATLHRKFGGADAHLLNDLTALGYAVPSLSDEHLSTLSDGNPTPKSIRQSLVIGIGTGFNVSPVLEHGGHVVCPAAECGHTGLPTPVVKAVEAAGVSPARFPTIEHLFSGRGLTTFCQQATGDLALQGQDAVAMYGQAANHDITAVIDQYAALIGWQLREYVMTFLPMTGVYFAGSVARAVLNVAPGPCIEVARRPNRMLKDALPPLRVIEADEAALLGCAGFVAA